LISFSFSALRGEDFAPRLSTQPERYNPAYFQLWLDNSMSVCICLTDEQRRQLLDVLSIAPPLPDKPTAHQIAIYKGADQTFKRACAAERQTLCGVATATWMG